MRDAVAVDGRIAAAIDIPRATARRDADPVPVPPHAGAYVEVRVEVALLPGHRSSAAASRAWASRTPARHPSTSERPRPLGIRLAQASTAAPRQRTCIRLLDHRQRDQPADEGGEVGAARDRRVSQMRWPSTWGICSPHSAVAVHRQRRAGRADGATSTGRPAWRAGCRPSRRVQREGRAGTEEGGAGVGGELPDGVQGRAMMRPPGLPSVHTHWCRPAARRPGVPR